MMLFRNRRIRQARVVTEFMSIAMRPDSNYRKEDGTLNGDLVENKVAELLKLKPINFTENGKEVKR